MKLIQCTSATAPVGFLLVAQNMSTYELLGFVDTADYEYNYDADHSSYDNQGRYKPRDGSLPNTELELRTEFFTIRAREETKKLKSKREADKESPIPVFINGAEYVFDLDEQSRENIQITITDFEVARAEALSLGWVDDGTIPWVLGDNSVLPVTAEDLILVRKEGVRRGLRLHMEYNQEKGKLEELIPSLN